MAPGFFVFWVSVPEPSQHISAEARYVLQLIGFSTGSAGCLLSLVTLTHSDWRLWLTGKNEVYNAGVARVGIWQICFPPYLNATENYKTLCCRRIALFEHFLPLEMKLGQVLIVTASFLALWGLLFSFLTPLNFFQRAIRQTRLWWLFMAGGIFYLLSSICILVPISWNVHSVFANASIHFPESFHLPLRPISQRNGGAIYLGYTSGILLLVGAICLIIQRGFMRPVRVIPM